MPIPAVLAGALITAGISTAVRGIGKGISTAVNRKRATEAMDEQLSLSSAQMAAEDAKSKEEMEAQFARDNELAQSGLSRGVEAIKENKKGFAFEKDTAEQDQVETSLSGLQGKTDQRKQRLFGKRDMQQARWGL